MLVLQRHNLTAQCLHTKQNMTGSLLQVCDSTAGMVYQKCEKLTSRSLSAHQSTSVHIARNASGSSRTVLLLLISVAGTREVPGSPPQGLQTANPIKPNSMQSRVHATKPAALNTGRTGSTKIKMRATFKGIQRAPTSQSRDGRAVSSPAVRPDSPAGRPPYTRHDWSPGRKRSVSPDAQQPTAYHTTAYDNNMHASPSSPDSHSHYGNILQPGQSPRSTQQRIQPWKQPWDGHQVTHNPLEAQLAWQLKLAGVDDSEGCDNMHDTNQQQTNLNAAQTSHRSGFGDVDMFKSTQQGYATSWSKEPFGNSDDGELFKPLPQHDVESCDIMDGRRSYSDTTAVDGPQQPAGLNIHNRNTNSNDPNHNPSTAKAVQQKRLKPHILGEQCSAPRQKAPRLSNKPLLQGFRKALGGAGGAAALFAMAKPRHAYLMADRTKISLGWSHK